MKRIIPLLCALLLSACTTIVKVEGEQVLNSRLSLRVSEAWNRFTPPGQTQPYETWTQEGLPLDHLRIWPGIVPGQALMSRPAGAAAAGLKDARLPTFATGLTEEQIIRLFEVVYSADGSIVKVTRVEPGQFAGGKGIRFEFSQTRKADDVNMLGVGWFSVQRDMLFAGTFVAPRLTFFPRLLPKAEAVVRTAAVKG